MTIILSVFAVFSVHAQTVSRVMIRVDTLHNPAQCPYMVKFTATIYSSGTGSLKYIWERSDNAIDNNNSFVTLSGTGTDVVTTTWTIGRSYVGWERLKIISPVQYTSHKGNFSLVCKAEKGQGQKPKN
jgi:hypothetical protein